MSRQQIKFSIITIPKVINQRSTNICNISRKSFEIQPGDGKMHWLPATPATLEECLESLSILLYNQAAKPKRHP